MKKFMTLVAMFAAVMMSFTACDKDDPKKPGGDDDDEPEFVSPITVDGVFTDWDALDASKVASATCVADSKHTALSKVKVYADNLYINVYLEFDAAQITDRSWTPVHIYLDADNSNATGGYGDEFTDANTDWMLETAIFSENAFNDYNASFWKWWGEVGGDGWLWSDPDVEGDESNNWGALLGEGSGISTGMGAGNKYEIQITRALLPGATFADTFGIGFDIQQNWSSVGVLPNASISEENPEGKAAKLKVTIHYTEVE